MSDAPIVPRNSGSTTGVPPTRSGSRPRSSGVILLGILTFVLMVGVVLLGWLVWQQMLQIENQAAKVDRLEEQSKTIQEELAVTSSSLEESDDEVKGSIGFWETEIRKLWDLGQKNLRPKITENTKAVTDIENRTNVLEARVEVNETNTLNATRQNQDMTDTVNLLQQQVNRKLDDVETRLDTTTEALDAIDKSRQSTNQRLLTLERSVRELRASRGP